MDTWTLMLLPVVALLGFAAGWVLRQRLGQKRVAKAEELAETILEEARSESESLKKAKLLEAREEVFQLKQKVEQECKDKLEGLQQREKTLAAREIELDRKVDVLNKKEQELNELRASLKGKESYLQQREAELEALIQEENQKLEQISGLSTEEAKRIQMENLLDTVKKESALEAQEIRDKARQTARRDAREILIQAIERSAISHVVDTTVSVVNLPDEAMKGRIIGREGRNIRAFESATGIEVLIDDTPKTVVLSGFDPMRREIAKQALEKLIYDGRIHPGRIEEVVEKTREEINERVYELGEQVIMEVGLHGVHPELTRLLGRQKFRTTYGQNLLQHSKEVAVIAGMMASQLGLDVALAKRAGLFHDIGKAAEEYGDTPVHEIGLELAKKYGEGEVVQNAIAIQSPRDNVPILSPITVLVQTADAISVSRPGAQKSMLENFLTRMRKLEEIATSFSGVVQAYALQAGREVRVIVEHNLVDDTKAQILANDISKRIRDEVEYPGQVKVTVIREYRSISYAK